MTRRRSSVPRACGCVVAGMLVLLGCSGGGAAKGRGARPTPSPSGPGFPSAAPTAPGVVLIPEPDEAKQPRSAAEARDLLGRIMIGQGTLGPDAVPADREGGGQLRRGHRITGRLHEGRRGLRVRVPRGPVSYGSVCSSAVPGAAPRTSTSYRSLSTTIRVSPSCTAGHVKRIMTRAGRMRIVRTITFMPNDHDLEES
ncbi:hypothetical protein ACWFQ8_13370 [Streptomyces sp. NPDC055254]